MSDDEVQEPVVPFNPAVAAYAPLSYQDSIGLYADSSRSHEWFNRLYAYLEHQRLPLATASTIVKQLLPGRDRNKVDLAHDESTSVEDFVDGLKRRLLRQPNVVKRSKSSLLNRKRKFDEPIHDYMLMIRSDLKAAFPDLEETLLTRLAQYECWKQLPDEMSCRAILKQDEDATHWCDRVDALYEMPPPAVASELGQPPIVASVKPDPNNNVITDLACTVKEQGKMIEKISQQMSQMMCTPAPQQPKPSYTHVYCKCNQLAVKLSVKRNGPNYGKFYYSCPNPREIGCGFFEWEQPPTSNRKFNQNWRNTSSNEQNREGNQHANMQSSGNRPPQ